MRPYCWIYPHYHPDGSVDLKSKGPQQWPILVLLQHFYIQDYTVAVIALDESGAIFYWKGDILEE